MMKRKNSVVLHRITNHYRCQFCGGKDFTAALCEYLKLGIAQELIITIASRRAEVR
jgi:hypothetical protein